MGEAARVVIFVEDPGAANFVAELPSVMTARKIEATLIADGPARSFLEQRGSDGFISVDGGAVAILEHFRPSLVMVGTSENASSPAFDLVANCREQGIPTVGVIDSPAASAFRFRGRSDDPLAWVPDWLFVPERWTARQYLALSYPPERLIVCGHPHYDYVRQVAKRLREDEERLRRSLYPGAERGDRILVFAAETSTGLNPSDYQRSEAYTLDGRGASIGRTEIVLEEFLDALALHDPRPYCVLRLHPKNELAEFDEYLEEFDHVSQREPTLDAIAAADGVVGMTTTLLVEAMLMEKPTLSIIPREVERGWLVTAQLGLTPCAATRSQVRAEIGQLLEHWRAADSSRVEEMLPSGSLERAADAVCRLIS